MAAAAAIAIALGIVGLIWGAMQMYKAKRLASAPFVKTGEAAKKGLEVASPKGAISVEGKVKHKELLTSPVTNTPCLYYELKVTGYWKDGDTSKSKEYVAEKEATTFGVNDGTGVVRIVAGEGGDFDALEKTFDETKKEGMFADLKGAFKGKGEPIMFGDYAFENPPMSDANKFQCVERVLKPQESLYVCGKVAEGKKSNKIGSPNWTSLILSTKTRDELLGSTQKAAKMFLIGSGGVILVGAILGGVSAAMGA